jgi:hypothetical protein
MPTTISTLPRAWRHPAAPVDRASDIMTWTALTVAGLLLAAVVLNLEINGATVSAPDSGVAATVPGVP